MERLMEVSFDTLSKGMFGISPAYGSFLAEAASFCLKLKTHTSPVTLRVIGEILLVLGVHWNDSVADLEATYADLEEATEYGAYAVALVTAVKLTGIPYVERSAKGTGIDYWLTDSLEGAPFRRAARLEISGILDGDEAAVTSRVSRKLKQTERSSGTSIPAYVAVVEFGRPQMQFVKKQTKKEEEWRTVIQKRCTAMRCRCTKPRSLRGEVAMSSA